TVGDFNKDGEPDLAVNDYGAWDNKSQTYTNSGISVLLGKGDGTFQAAGHYSVGTNPKYVAVGDFNGDGKPDLAAANTTFAGTVSVLVGRGDGSFHSAVNYSVETNPITVAVGDCNRDGKP